MPQLPCRERQMLDRPPEAGCFPKRPKDDFREKEKWMVSVAQGKNAYGEWKKGRQIAVLFHKEASKKKKSPRLNKEEDMAKRKKSLVEKKRLKTYGVSKCEHGGGVHPQEKQE